MFDYDKGNDQHQKVVIMGDTDGGRDLSFLGKCNVLLHECTYLDFKNPQYKHSYCEVAARAANQVHADALLLTHFSVRYKTSHDFSEIFHKTIKFTRSRVTILNDFQPFYLNP